jgi:peptidoglycan hydrolase CwlO-like protein
VTITTSHVDAIKAIAGSMTPERIAALQATVDSRVGAWQTFDQQIIDLDAEISSYSTQVTSAQTSITTAQSQATTNATNITNLQAEITNLQAQLAAGGPPATAADVAERAQVVALANELGVTW